MSMSRRSMYLAVWAVCLGTMLVGISCADEQLPKKYTETVTTKNGEQLSFEMVLIPAGTFVMGSPASEAGRADHEGPQHKVRLNTFYLCSTETTIDLFLAYYQETVRAKEDFITVAESKKDSEQTDEEVDAISGPTPVYGDMTMGYGKKNPAIGMTWNNAMTFCKWLSHKTGGSYRLPTEAEWEYACRAGTSNAYSFGDSADQLADYVWYEDTADAETSEVGKKKPNAWGLHDMLGNVREWVHDFYSPTAYGEAAAKQPAVNPQGPTTGKVHVARGGDYTSGAADLRCAARTFEETWWRSGDPQIPKSRWWLPEMDFIGFRVARSVGRDTPKASR